MIPTNVRVVTMMQGIADLAWRASATVAWRALRLPAFFARALTVIRAFDALFLVTSLVLSTCAVLAVHAVFKRRLALIVAALRLYTLVAFAVFAYVARAVIGTVPAMLGDLAFAVSTRHRHPLADTCPIARVVNSLRISVIARCAFSLVVRLAKACVT